MEKWSICLIVLLASATLALLIRLLCLRASIRETAEELCERLSSDTNTLISVSSGDRTVRALASEINKQLIALRRERLRLQNGDAALRAAVTGISHDIRTPLTAICGYLDLLERENLADRPARYVSVIRERTEAMRALTDQLLRCFVDSEAAEELKMSSICVNEILESSLAGAWGACTQRGIVPSIEITAERVIRTLDPDALRRVLDNILSNAVKYSDGDLSVTLTRAGELRFENSASGLDAVRAEQLFDRYFTVNSAGGGVGLGLSIAKLLTNRMGGDISASYCRGRLIISLCFSAACRDAKAHRNTERNIH